MKIAARDTLVSLFLLTSVLLSIPTPGWTAEAAADCDRRLADISIEPPMHMVIDSDMPYMVFGETLAFVQDLKFDKSILDAAEDACLRALDQDPENTDRMLQYGRILAIRRDRKWSKYVLEAANQGNLHAQMFAAAVFIRIDAPDARKQAFYWMRRAVESGHVGAAVLVAVMYIDGKGVEKDSEKGITMLRKYAAQGDPWAHYFLATEYYLHKNLPRDDAKAFEHAKFAADRKSPPAMVLLGDLYMGIDRISKDWNNQKELFAEISMNWNSARDLFIEAFELGFLDGAIRLGYYFGEKFYPFFDEKKSILWYCQGGKDGTSKLKNKYGNDNLCQ
jgi:TPR repeat protein